jgi:predicted nucleic-acid-binding protein
MIGLDTNVLARFLLDDDVTQSLAARKAIRRAVAAGERLVICAPMFLELEWVLRSREGSNKPTTVALLRGLLELHDVEIIDETAVEWALESHESKNVDFAECLFHSLYLVHGCSGMMSFDKRAQSHLAGCIAP